MRERDRKRDERGKSLPEREEVKIVMKNRERAGVNENEVRELKNRKKGKESNDLVRRRKDKARRTRAEERRNEEGKGYSSKTGRVTFISGATVHFPNTGFRDGVKGESRTGHIQLFFGGVSPSHGSIFLFAWV